MPTLLAHAEGKIAGSVSREFSADPARVGDPGMRGVSGRENREISWPPVVVMAGRAAQGRPRSYA